MSKQTSQMYGIKVKKTKNYADEMEDIYLYYEDGIWVVKSNFENVFMDGVQYGVGDEIVRFEDGEVVTYTILAQHQDTVPYTNYLYNIYSNSAANPRAGQAQIEYRVTQSDRSHAGDPGNYELVFFKLVNGLIGDNKKYVSVKQVKNYKKAYGVAPKMYNLQVDWNDHVSSGHPVNSWTIKAGTDYITYDGQRYRAGEELDTFNYDDPILMEILDETNKYINESKQGETPVVTITRRPGNASWEWSKENILHDEWWTHKDVYYNGHYHKAMYLMYSKPTIDGCYKIVKKLAIAYADPYWYCVAAADNLEFNNRILKKGALIRAWSPGDSIDFSAKYESSARKPKTEGVNYDTITYELIATGNGNVTVIRLVNDEEPPDSRIEVTPNDSPKVCWNIELRVEGPNWTIYSKCNFIKYNGRTYMKNKSILSFGLDEELHIEIKDDTNKYYIKGTNVYRVTNQTAASVFYKLWTSKLTGEVIIEKTVNNESEPWDRCKMYECIYEPHDYEDLELTFDNSVRKWSLYSLSDNVYSDGVKYDTGDLIATWNLYENKELNHIEALKESEEIIKVEIYQEGFGEKIGLDTDEIIPDPVNQPFFEVIHSSAKALWQIRANCADIWNDGVNYKTGDIILEVKDKTFVDPFNVMVVDKSVTPYRNLIYSISTTYDAVKDTTTLMVDPQTGSAFSFTDKSSSDGRLVYTFDKQTAKSMYGYIWKRDMPGPVPPGPEPHTLYLIIPALFNKSGRNNKNLISVYCGAGKKIIREYIKNVSGLSNDYAPDYGLNRKTYFNKFTKDGEEFGFYRKIIKAPFVLIANYDGTVKCKRLAYQFPNGSYTGLDTDVTLTGTLLKDSVVYDPGPSSNAIKCDYQIIKNGSYAQYSLIKMSNPVDLEIEFHSGETFYIDDNTFVCVSETNPEAQYLQNLYVFKNGRYFKANFDVAGYNSICEDLEDEGYGLRYTPLEIGWFLFDGILYSYLSGAKPREEWTDRLQSDTYKYYLIRYDPESDSTRFMYLGTNGSNNNIDPILLYSRIIKCNGKYYAFRKGQSWTYSLVIPSTEFFIEGNINEYCYEITSEADIAIIGNPVKTYQGTVTYESILPNIICNHICSIDRIDINDLYIIKGFPSEYIDHDSGGDFINSMGVSPLNQLTEIGDYVFWRYIVRGSAEANQMIVAFDNPFFEQSNANFAWSLANYGVNRDLT